MNTKSRIACTILGLAVVACATVGMLVSARGAQSSPPAPRPSISATAPTPGGTEVFVLDVYEPWDGAGHRVVALYGASIKANGLVGFNRVRISDVGQRADAVRTSGASYTCTATLHNVASWADVQSENDVSLTVETKQ